MNNNTCVYLHTRTDGVVFYVGIGSLKRAEDHRKRNKYWHNITERHGYTVTVLHENLPWEVACAIEIELIKKYRELSGDKLCNLSSGGDTSAKGIKREPFSPETREKMRASAKGNTSRLGVPFSEEARAKISKARKGTTLSEEHRAKIGAAHKGRVFSDESRAKMSAGKKGKGFSEEHRAKLSVARKNISPETRAKMSVSKKGKTLSADHRAKMSASQKARHSKQKEPHEQQ